MESSTDTGNLKASPHPGAGASAMASKANHHPRELLVTPQHPAAVSWGGFGLNALPESPSLLFATAVGHSSSSVGPWGWLGLPGTASLGMGRAGSAGSAWRKQENASL